MDSTTNGNSTDTKVFVPREVMLFMGEVGTGKTTAALNVALSKPDDLFHYLVADRDPSKLYSEIGGRPANWLEYDAFDFADARGHIANLVQQTRVNPESQWIVVDTIGQMYKTAGDQYAWLQYHKTISDVVTERIGKLRAKSDAGTLTKDDRQFADSLFSGLTPAEWNIIKQYFYGDIMWPLIRRSRAHIILLCHPNPVDIFNGRFHRPIGTYLEATKSRVEELGLVPDLHKDIPKLVDTWLYFSCSADSDKRYMYTLKETGPRIWLHQPTEYKDFWPDYNRLVIDAYSPHPTA